MLNQRKHYFIAIMSVAICIAVVLMAFTPNVSATTLNNGDLIKASGPAVYYYGADSKRYVFPNQNTYLSWYANFSTVKTISDSELANIPIGGNVTYRPGVNLVKITTDPKVYAVDAHGILRWIATAAVAQELYGPTWTQKVEDLPDAFFVNYNVGSQISSASDFYPTVVKNNASSINNDKSLITTPELANYSSSLGLKFFYWTPSCGKIPLSISCKVDIKVNEKTTSDGSIIKIGREQDLNIGNGDVTIEIHKIPSGKTAETYAKELVDKILGGVNCSYSIVKNQASSYTTFVPTESGSGGCFVGAGVSDYTQYNNRMDLLIAAYNSQDPFMSQDQIDAILSTIAVY